MSNVISTNFIKSNYKKEFTEVRKKIPSLSYRTVTQCCQDIQQSIKARSTLTAAWEHHHPDCTDYQELFPLIEKIFQNYQATQTICPPPSIASNKTNKSEIEIMFSHAADSTLQYFPRARDVRLIDIVSFFIKKAFPDLTLASQLFQALEEFESQKNDKNLLIFLNNLNQFDISKFNDKSKEQKNAVRMEFETKDLKMVLECLIRGIQEKRYDLLEHKLGTLSTKNKKITDSDKYYGALLQLNLLEARVQISLIHLQDAWIEWDKRAQTYDDPQENIRNAISFNISSVLKKLDLTKMQFIDLRSFFSKLTFNLSESLESFMSNLRLFISDFSKNYSPVCAFPFTVDTNHVLENEDIFKNYFTRVRECKKALLDQAQEIVRLSTILKNLFLFSQLESFDEIMKEREKGVNHLFKCLVERILDFSRNKSPDHLLAVVKILQKDTENQQVKKRLYQWYSNIEHFYSQVSSHLNLIPSALNQAEAAEPHLYLFCPKMTKKTHYQPFLSLSISAEAPSEDQEIVDAEANNGIEISLSQNISWKDLIQMLRQSKLWDDLARIGSGFGTKEALRNSEIHFKELLSLFESILDLSDESLSQQEMLAFAVNSMRHGALAIEQLLSGFDRHSNTVKNHEELKSHLSHDLSALLLSSNFGSKPLKAIFTDWIKDNNFGEILIRNLFQGKTGRTSLENYPETLRHFLKGEDSHLTTATELVNYLRGMIKLAHELTMRFSSSLKQPSLAVKKNFLKVLHLVANKLQIDSLPKTPLSLLPILKKVEENLSHLRREYPSFQIEKTVDNLTSHLLTQLTIEVNRQKDLAPLNAFHSYTNVLFLNQLIAEQTLHCLTLLVNEENLAENSTHHLMTTVEMLGMKKEEFSTEEINFLMRGDATRLICRYPLSYLQMHRNQSSPEMTEIAALINEARRISSGLQFPPEMLQRIKTQTYQDVETLTSILNKIFDKYRSLHYNLL